MANYKQKVCELMPQLKIAPLLGGFDLNLENPSWEDADLRVCIVQNGDFFTKATSATIVQLASLAREAERESGKKVFIDFSFQPDTNDTEKLRKNGLKEVFGWSSFRSMEDFDVLLCTFSIHYESLGFCTVLWGAGLPAFWNQRKDDPKCPLIIGGGIIAGLLEPLYGHKEGSLLDLTFIGEAEDRFPAIFQSIIGLNRLWKTDRTEACKRLVQTYDNLYFPPGYTHEYQGSKLIAIKRNFDWVPEKVKIHRSWNPRPPMFEDKLLLTANDGAGRGELQISHGCMGFGACFFCQEGNDGGTWREYDLTAIVENMERLKQACAPNSISFFSLNSNYYSRVFDMYYEVAKRFDYISVIAFRADVVSAVPEYIRFLKALGTFRLTVALEGISERIRAAILNKNLTWDQFLRTAEYVFRERFVMLKVNLIFSGHEEPEDVEEFCQAMQKLNELKDKYGAKTSIVWSMTTLVTYWNVGLQWQPRKATIAELFRERKFKKAVEIGRTLGHRFRFHSGAEFVFQQFLVDAGRSMTNASIPHYQRYWEENRSINTMTFFDAVNLDVRRTLGIFDDALHAKHEEQLARFQKAQENLSVLKSNGTVEPSVEAQFSQVEAEYRAAKLADEGPTREFFGHEYGFDEITPAYTYDILPPFVKKIYYMAVGKRGTKYCLKSPATPDVRCKTCGFCEDDDYSQEVIIKRNIKSARSVEDVEQAIFLNKPKSTLRVVFKVGDDVISRHRFKIVLSHYIAARFLRADRTLARDFHGVGNYADYVITFHDQYDSWAGLNYFDINFRTSLEELRSEVGPDFKDIIGRVNSQCKTCQVLAVYALPFTPNSLKNVKSVWQFKTPVAKAQLTETFSAYNGKIKDMEKGAALAAVVVEVPLPKDQFAVYTVQRPKETIGFFTLGARHNPYNAIWSFFGFKPELGRALFMLERVGAQDVSGIPCPACTKEMGWDVLRNQKAIACPECTAKLLATKLVKASSAPVPVLA